MDYLKQLTRHTFDMEAGKACTEVGPVRSLPGDAPDYYYFDPQNDVSFARYIAEALSTLEYKRNEEPMSVIHYLNSALAVTGLQVVHSLEDVMAGGGGLMASITPTGSPQKPAADGENPVRFALSCEKPTC